MLFRLLYRLWITHTHVESIRGSIKKYVVLRLRRLNGRQATFQFCVFWGSHTLSNCYFSHVFWTTIRLKCIEQQQLSDVQQDEQENTAQPSRRRWFNPRNMLNVQGISETRLHVPNTETIEMASNSERMWRFQASMNFQTILRRTELGAVQERKEILEAAFEWSTKYALFKLAAV